MPVSAHGCHKCSSRIEWFVGLDRGAAKVMLFFPSTTPASCRLEALLNACRSFLALSYTCREPLSGLDSAGSGRCRPLIEQPQHVQPVIMINLCTAAYIARWLATVMPTQRMERPISGAIVKARISRYVHMRNADSVHGSPALWYPQEPALSILSLASSSVLPPLMPGVRGEVPRATAELALDMRSIGREGLGARDGSLDVASR